MAFELRELKGSVFKNDKVMSENSPQYKGDCKIEGKDYWIAAWVKESSKGKFFSLSFKEKQALREKAQETPLPDIDNVDDLPF